MTKYVTISTLKAMIDIIKENEVESITIDDFMTIDLILHKYIKNEKT